MDLIQAINSNSEGAKFVRADLHIHSYGEHGSYDVVDTTMTPQGIVDLAINENIQVISITDHNEINNVKIALDYAVGKEILIIPGVELSTTNGHLLVYLPDFNALRNFYGQLSISDDKKMCNNTIVQCLDAANAQGGIGVAAHIELGSGFEMYMNGYTPFKEAVLTHPNLLGLEISSAVNETWFTDRDQVAERKNLIRLRRNAINEETTYDLAKLMSSDAHALTTLGRNAAGNKKMTRLKMDELNFHAFKIALLDSSARVRLEDLIPATIPHFKGIKFDGGFLDGQVIKFSGNLTCIIGGRGAGKSTVLESLRAVSGNGCRENLLDNEVWPNRISLLYEDEAGRQQVLVKDKQKDTINATDPGHGITNIKVEVFGQGEAAETIQHCDKNQNILVRYFDGFVDFENLLGEDRNLCQRLLDNQTLIERLSIDVSSIAEIEKAKKNADDQIAALKAKNAAKAVELEQGLADERALRKGLIEQLKNLISGLKTSLSNKALFNLVLNYREDKIIIGKDEFKEVKEIVKKYSDEIDNYSLGIVKDSDDIRAKLNAQINIWAAKEKEVQDKIEDIRIAIESKGGKLDIGFIRKVTKDSSDFNVQLETLKGKSVELITAKSERKTLLQNRKLIKSEIYKKRYAFVHNVNQNLKATVSDFAVNVKIQQGVLSDELTSVIKDAMGWRTSQVPKADLIVRSIAYPDLLNSIHKGDFSLIYAIKTEDGSLAFSSSEAQQVIKNLQSPQVLFKIERCEYGDLITINLTKQVNTAGNITYVHKDFAKLSLGQQQSILLSILLSSNRNCPLLIDQPEDNLDSEFIYKTLVKSLRRVKEHRQVIIVTHNANIAVLGDAELITPLKSTNEKTIIMNRGSIDNSVTKSMTCDILEGGEKAFKKRKDIYGY